MDRVIPAQLVHDEWELIFGRVNEEAPDTTPFLVVAPEDAPFLHSTIGVKHDINPESMLQRISGYPGVWSVIFFSDEMKDSAAILAARGDDLRSAIGFFAYSYETDQKPPPFGAMVIFDRDALGRIAARQPLFRRAWETVRELPTARHWVVILDTKGLDTKSIPIC